MIFVLWALVGVAFSVFPGNKGECGLSCKCTWIEFPPMSGWVCRSPNGPACCCEGQDPLCADVSFQTRHRTFRHHITILYHIHCIILPHAASHHVNHAPSHDLHRTALHSRSVLPPKASASARATPGGAPTTHNLSWRTLITFLDHPRPTKSSGPLGLDGRI